MIRVSVLSGNKGSVLRETCLNRRWGIMKRKTTIAGIAIALIAGFFLVASSMSTWAWEEKNPLQPSIQDQWNNQQQNPSQNIPQQQGSDMYPQRPQNDPNDPSNRKPMADGKVCYGECMNADAGGRYVWKCGWIYIRNGKYYHENNWSCRNVSCDGKCPNTNRQEKEAYPQRFDNRAQ